MTESIRRADRGNVTVLTVPIRLDIAMNNVLDQALRNLAGEHRFNIVLDCERLQFMDSMTIEILLKFQRLATENGGDLKFAALTEPIRDVFYITKLEAILRCYPTVEEAINAFL